MRSVTYLDNADFKKEVLNGIKDLATITAQTLGPGGRPVLLEQDDGTVLSTKDGVTVARHFTADTPIRKIVAKAAVEASERTVRSCGDGTTTSVLLAYAIVESGQKWLENNKGYSPQRLSRELKEIFNTEIQAKIIGLAKPIRNLGAVEAKKAIWHVAMVSSNFDDSIANAVTQAVDIVGDDGMIQVEEGTGGLDTTVEHREGFPINSGLSDLGGAASTAFVNRKSYGDCVLGGSYVCLYDGEINDIESVIPLLERVSKEVDSKGMPTRHPLLIVAHGFGDSVLRSLAQNFRQQILSVVPLITPRNGQANGRQQFLYDLSAYVEGLIFDPTGKSLHEAMPSNIGFAEEVRIGVNDSVIITEPDEEKVEQRISELKQQMIGASEFDRDKLRYRIGQLTGGVATVYAGGSTAFEARERRDRVIDAVSAVKSAMELGVVPGGGTALLHIARSLGDSGPSEIFKKALTRPFTQILLNAGIASNEEEALLIGSNMGNQEDGNFMVYDALRREIVEFWTSGIFDPAKVTINALQNAISVAQLLMTTGGAIAKSLNDSENQVKAFQDGIKSLMSGNGDL